MARILVADDDAHIREVIEYALGQEGMHAVCVSNGLEVLSAIRQGGIDLVVLDVLMPMLDGLSTCKAIRRESKVPILFLSSRGEEVDRVLGFELGGDDYVTKPFSPRELVLRIKTILKRAHGVASEEHILTFGHIEIDSDAHEVRVRGVLIPFTVTEFSVLHVLLSQPGRVLSRAQLIDRSYATEHHVTERTVDTFIRRIRSKLREHGVDPIETVHGLGYKARLEPSALSGGR